jgi:hypothetical protein
MEDKERFTRAEVNQIVMMLTEGEFGIDDIHVEFNT